MENLGNQQECPTCGTTFFDFNQPDVVSCPNCPSVNVENSFQEDKIITESEPVEIEGAENLHIDYELYLQTWRTMESVIMQLSEDECWELLKREREGRARPSFILRINTRATVLKRRNERGDAGRRNSRQVNIDKEQNTVIISSKQMLRMGEYYGKILQLNGPEATGTQNQSSTLESPFLEEFLTRILEDPGTNDQREFRRILSTTPRSVLHAFAILDHYARLIHPRVTGKSDGPFAFIYGVQRDFRMRPRILRIAWLPIPPYDKIHIKADPRITDRKGWFQHLQESSREWKSCCLAVPIAGIALEDLQYVIQQFIESVECAIASKTRLNIDELTLFPDLTSKKFEIDDSELTDSSPPPEDNFSGSLKAPPLVKLQSSLANFEESSRSNESRNSIEGVLRPPDLDEDMDGEVAEVISEDSSTIRWRDDSHTIHEFCRRYGRGRIELQPEFQRDYVWTLKIARRFIESIFLGLPIPSIYLAETEDNQLLVIDGQQRLQTIIDFHENRFPLSNVSVVSLSGLEGLRFRDLPTILQDRFEDYRLSVIVLEKSCSPQLKFDMFERLNQGSVKLNKQELRNCLYRGSYNKLLTKLADMEAFLLSCGWKQQRRMRGEELVLRFFTFHFRNIDSIKTYEGALNEEMRINQFMTPEGLTRREKLFRETLSTCVHVFGPHPFRMWNMGKSIKDPTGRWEDRLNSVVFEILMTSLASYDKPRIIANADSIQEEFIHLLSTDQFMVDSLTLGTNSREKMRYRHDTWRAALRSLLESTETEPRFYQIGFKRELWQRDPICGICKQVIHSLEDSAVDHIVHYWRGGQTIPSNARLTHQYCNSRRGGRD